MKIQHLVLPGMLASALILSACGGGGDNRKKISKNAPTATNSSFTTQADTPLNGKLTGADADGDKLTYAVAMQPTNGKVTINSDGSFTYSPAVDTVGTDQFTFHVVDGSLRSLEPATVTIKIDPLQVAFGAYSRTAFAQAPGAQPLPINTRIIEQNVTDPAAYDDLLQ